MVFTLANLSDKYSGTRLFTVLNIKDFNCLSHLSARLFHLRARGIWADLTSQLDPVIMRSARYAIDDVYGDTRKVVSDFGGLIRF